LKIGSCYDLYGDGPFVVCGVKTELEEAGAGMM